MNKTNTLNKGSYFSKRSWEIYQQKYYSIVADSQRSKIYKKSCVFKKKNLIKIYQALLKTLSQIYKLSPRTIKLGLNWKAPSKNNTTEKWWLITSFRESKSKYLITIFQEDKYFLHWISFSLFLTWNKKIKFTYQEELLTEQTYEKHSPQANLQNHLAKNRINKRFIYLVNLLRRNYVKEQI